MPFSRRFPTAWRGPQPGHEFVICTDCNGSGEGHYDGTRCNGCGGGGEVEVESSEVESQDNEGEGK